MEVGTLDLAKPSFSLPSTSTSTTPYINPLSLPTNEVNQRLKSWESPMPAAVIREGGHSACFFCGNLSSLKCSRCRAASYCSGSCQLKDWKSGHKYECVETEMATSQKGSSRMAKDEGEQPRKNTQSTMPSDINNYDRFDFPLDMYSLLLRSSPEEGTSNAKPFIESSEEELQEEQKLVRSLKLERDEAQLTKRNVEEIGQELANDDNDLVYAISRAEAAERELQEERKLVQRLKLEQDDVQITKIKVEEIGQELAKSRNDVEYDVSRADSAVIECAKMKRELLEERKLVQRLKLEQGEAQISKRKDAAEIECDKLKRELQEERKLVQRLKLEQDEAQIAKRKVEEIGQELVNSHSNVEYAVSRADTAEIECAKVKRELQEERKLVQSLKLELNEAKRKVEELGQALANARNDVEFENAISRADAAEIYCAKMKRELQEERKLVQRLKLEHDEALMAMKVEEISQELANARNDLRYAISRADTAEIECAKMKRELKEEQKLVERLTLKLDEAQIAKRKVEEMGQELKIARNEADYAISRADAAERELKEEQKLVQRLTQDHNEAQIAKRKVDEIVEELKNAHNDVGYAISRADAAEDDIAKMKRELKEEQNLVQRLKLELDEAQIAKRKVEELSYELVNARNDVEYAISIADAAEVDCANTKRELQEERNIVRRLELEHEDIEEAQITRKVEEMGQELANARDHVEYAISRADTAENEWMKAEKLLQEERDLVHILNLECEEIRQTSTRVVEEKEQELANALDAAAAAESRAAAAEARLSELEEEIRSSDDNDRVCAICLTNEKDMAFGCGHLTCEDCGRAMNLCPICREPITSRLKLFPG